MLKTLAPFLIALGLFLSTEWALSLPKVQYLLDYKVQNSLVKKLAALQTDNPTRLDVLFLGSSRTDSGFDTASFEQAASKPVNAYNLGLPSGDYVTAQWLLADHIQHYGKPKRVLLEVSEFMLNPNMPHDSRLLYAVTLIQHNPALLQIVLNTSDIAWDEKQAILCGLLSRIYRYRVILQEVTLLGVLEYAAKNKLPSWKYFQGWKQRPVETAIMQNPAAQRQSAEATQGIILQGFEKAHSASLARFIAYCKQQDIPVVLVQWPTHPTYTRLFQRHAISHVIAAEMTRITQAMAVPMIDLNMHHPATLAGLYADTDHLSTEGARYYTKQLAAFLH